MKAIIHGKIVLGHEVIEGQALYYDDVHIIGLGPHDSIRADSVIDAMGLYVSPGWIDTHIHGYGGMDTSDGSWEELRDMARALLHQGITAWLPTTMTLPPADTERVLDAVRRVMAWQADQPPVQRGATVLGVHLEGPYLSPDRRGAQAAGPIRPLDADWVDANADVIRKITLAPEMPGALDFIHAVSRRQPHICLSMGHTNATYDQAQAAVAAGVRCVTHLFNAQTPMMTREPGVAGCALTEDRLYCELIADGFHVHPALFSLVARAKADRLLLITDGMRAGGMGDGTYTLGGQTVTVRGRECRLADGTIAGSVLRLADAMAHMYRWGNVSFAEVVAMASEVPARTLGQFHKGALRPGCAPDMLFIDSEFHVRQVITSGIPMDKIGYAT